MSKIALFTNIHDKPFVGFWNGKKKTFAPGQTKHMPAFLAAHYAKHLTNKMLLEKNLENCTSPKFPEQVPEFWEIFNKICVMDPDSDEDEMDDVEVETEVANRPTFKTAVDSLPPQVVGGSAEDTAEENDEFNLENKPAA